MNEGCAGQLRPESKPLTQDELDKINDIRCRTGLGKLDIKKALELSDWNVEVAFNRLCGKLYTLVDYQKHAEVFAKYPKIGDTWVYPILGLSGEVGEYCEKVKKMYRDNDGVVTGEFLKAIKDELGDILWYLSANATEFGFSLEDIAKNNISKLSSRAQRGVINGSGDNR